MSVMRFEKPTQAVILAGGKGERLKPLTDTMPKPMLQFQGKPFLEHLLLHLKSQGFKQILLLLGYLPHVIQNYFGDGTKIGLKIDYSISDIENETGRRMKLAEHQMDPCFLFMYCDNYWPLNMERVWNQYCHIPARCQLTIYSNKDHYTRDNVLVSDDKMIICYDKNRASENLSGIDIGFAIMRKDILELLPNQNVNFEKTVFPYLVEKRELSAYVTDHRYYSVGSIDRLPETEAFLRRRPAVILDRDGVLNEKPPKAEYVKTMRDFKWMPGAKEAVRLLNQSGFLVIIVTNQAGIARDIMTEEDLLKIHEQIKKELSEMNAKIDAIYYCAHGWDAGCECRKPRAGMLFQAQRDFRLDLTDTYFIGDDIRDQQAGDAADCKTLLVTPDRPLLELVQKKILSETTIAKK